MPLAQRCQTVTDQKSESSYGTTSTSAADHLHKVSQRSKRTTPHNALSKSRQETTRLLNWFELDHWLQDNEYLLTGYRSASYSYSISLKSVFKIHNDTVNIWSHMIATAQFLTYLCYMWYYWPSATTHNLSDRIVISLYRLSVVVCFGLSFTYHIVTNHSQVVRLRFSELDGFGVVGVIYCTGLAATYFEFYCQPAERYTFWAISTVFGIVSAVFSLRPGFKTSAYRSMRVYAHSLLGLSCFLPILHGYFFYGYEGLDQRMSVSYFIGLAICQFSGGLIYGARIPERWFPEIFDIIGASHQIMHVLVVMGAMIYDHGLIRAMTWWELNSEAVCFV